MYGSSLKKRRLAFGFDSQDVAELSGLAKARVVAVEGGAAPSAHELERLGNALAFDPAALVRGDLPKDPHRSLARFRAPAGVQRLSPHDTRLLVRARELSEIASHLGDRLGDPLSPLHELRDVHAPGPPAEAWRPGYALGSHAREALSPARRPMESVQGLLETLGVHVAFVSLEDRDLHAVSLPIPGSMPFLLLNRRAQRVKLRLSRRAILAHELCHLLHDGGERHLIGVATRRAGDSAVERRANAFAPSFLAPGAWLQLSGDTAWDRVRQLAMQWGLSFKGAALHAHSLGMIELKDRDEFVAQRGPMETVFEPEVARLPIPALGLAVEPSSLVLGLVQDVIVRAFGASHISSGRARELLRFQ